MLGQVMMGRVSRDRCLSRVSRHERAQVRDIDSAGTPRNNEKVTDVTSCQGIIWCDKAVGGLRSSRTARYLGLVPTRFVI